MKKLIFCVSLLLGSIACAQDSSSVRTAQISFITPLGTNGLKSGKITNRLSLNIFSGYHGGLQGAEFGGFVNVIKGNVKGAQFAGFGNTVLGETEGVQFAGFYNVNKSFMRGAQFAGFANTIIDSAEAGQFAGFSNLVKGKLNGCQGSGFSNVVMGNVFGAQFSGFNNVTIGNMNGVQASGFINVVTKDIYGAQLSGFANYARKVKGFQVGIINIADTIEDGAAIGLLSFVRKGYHKLELSGGESFQGAANLKLGTHRFYNIFSVGAKIDDETLFWGLGYGIGTLFPLNQKLDMNVDLMAYQVNHNTNWSEYMNILSKAKVQVAYSFNKIHIFGGASLNVLVSDRVDNEGKLIQPTIAPRSIYESAPQDIHLKIYPGFNLGFRI